MTSRKIVGYVFIIVAVLLTLAIVGQLPTIFGMIHSFFKIFTGKLNSDQTGEIFGHIIYWIIHFVATFALWKYGIRWTRKEAK
jgi:predicted membrane protein